MNIGGSERKGRPLWTGCLNDFQANLVLRQQLRQRRDRRLIGHQAIDQRDRAQTNHGVAPELAGVCRKNDLPRVGDDRLGNSHFLIVKIQQTAVFVYPADTDQRESTLNCVMKSTLA